jgi:hypothetical protein
MEKVTARKILLRHLPALLLAQSKSSIHRLCPPESCALLLLTFFPISRGWDDVRLGVFGGQVVLGGRIPTSLRGSAPVLRLFHASLLIPRQTRKPPPWWEAGTKCHGGDLSWRSFILHGELKHTMILPVSAGQRNSLVREGGVGG